MPKFWRLRWCNFYVGFWSYPPLHLARRNPYNYYWILGSSIPSMASTASWWCLLSFLGRTRFFWFRYCFRHALKLILRNELIWYEFQYSNTEDSLIPKRFPAILRTILFALIWLFSGGKHHLWIFPNLTEDVGPIESFMPLYTYKYTGTDFKV